MSNSDSQNFISYILPIIAIFLGVHMSIFFGQISVLHNIYGIIEDLGHLFVIIAIISSYFLIFYTIYKIKDEKSISIWILGGFIFVSILIILIGILNTKGIFVKIMLWLLIAILFTILWKKGFGQVQDWYLIILFPLAFSTIYPAFYSSELIIGDKGVWLEDIDNENESIYATLFLQIEAKKCDAENVRVKIICTDQISINKDECEFLGIENLKNNKKKVIKWRIIIKDKNSHSFYLYLVSNGKVSNKMITIYPENNHWKAKIKDVKHLENLIIFLKHNPFLSLF
jgi:hypothetical protein